MVSHMNAIALPERAGLDQSHAGFVSRAIAFMLDLAIMCAILLMTGVFAQLVTLYFPVNKLLAHIVGAGMGDALKAPLALAFAVVVFAGYPVFFWSMMGQTPGKWALGLRVVRTDGRPLSIWRSLLRYLAYWVSALPLFLGFAWIAVDRRRQGWHDKIAGTCVIYTARAHHGSRVARSAAQPQTHLSRG